MPTVLVVNLYYAPDTASTGRLLHELCAGLASKGVDVHVLTGQPSYSGNVSEAPEIEILDGVHVHRLSTLTSNAKANFFTRILSYVGFMSKAWFRATKIAKEERIDAVITVSNPPTVGLIGRRVARKLNVPFHYILFDIHPDAVEIARTVTIPLGVTALWRRLNQRIWKSATTIAVPGTYMRDRLIQSHNVSPSTVKVFPLWATPELTEFEKSPSVRKEMGFREDSLLIIHAGNVGLMHRMNDLVDAVGQVADQNVEMAVTGGGVALESAKKLAQSRGFENIKFLGYLDDDLFSTLLSSSDIAATTLIDGMEQVSMPSRALTYMSAGLPVLSLMPKKSDIGDLVISEDCGWVAESSHETVKILSMLASDNDLIDSAAKNARSVYLKKFSRLAGVQRFFDLITP
jgi:colanic acid biosynthesis glycosyl transferase WcaI